MTRLEGAVRYPRRQRFYKLVVTVSDIRVALDLSAEACAPNR